MKSLKSPCQLESSLLGRCIVARIAEMAAYGEAKLRRKAESMAKSCGRAMGQGGHQLLRRRVQPNQDWQLPVGAWSDNVPRSGPRQVEPQVVREDSSVG